MSSRKTSRDHWSALSADTITCAKAQKTCHTKQQINELTNQLTGYTSKLEQQRPTIMTTASKKGKIRKKSPI